MEFKMHYLVIIVKKDCNSKMYICSWFDSTVLQFDQKHLLVDILLLWNLKRHGM